MDYFSVAKFEKVPCGHQCAFNLVHANGPFRTAQVTLDDDDRHAYGLTACNLERVILTGDDDDALYELPK
jgi:hypothetical protein